MAWDDPFVVVICAVCCVIALMFVGQWGYRFYSDRSLRRDDRVRRHMSKLRKIPIEPRRSDPSESNEE